MKQGLLHPVNFINKWGDFDSEISEQKLIVEIEQRKELFKLLFTEPIEAVPNNENNVSEQTSNNIEMQEDKIENDLK
jgi:hypothetical protein